MRHAIIEKLHAHLEKGLETESDVVYVFIEIGKFLEQSSKVNYDLIRFYRNWIAHSKIDRLGLAGHFPERLEGLVDQIVSQQRLDVFEMATEEISKLVAFHSLFDELRSFFHQNGIGINFLKDREHQEVFSRLLIGVLADVPLVFSPERFKHLRSFSFQETRRAVNTKDMIASWYIEAKSYRFQGPVTF